jgi:hypothetical protein
MKGRGSGSRANANNHANQLNSNNAAYWSSRGLSKPSSAESDGVAPPTAAVPQTGDATQGGHTNGNK